MSAIRAAAVLWLGLAALLTVSGCGGDDGSSGSGSAGSAGGSLSLELDSDGDGYNDDVDFFPYGQDTIDTDGDGISNAYDLHPYEQGSAPTAPSTVTPSNPTAGTAPSNVESPSTDDWDLDGLPNRSDPYPAGEDAYLDSDGDGTPDIRDPDPHLNDFGDADGDGFANGDDPSQFHNDDYDLDGHTNSNDSYEYDHNDW
jgi:hypothetical protein